MSQVTTTTGSRRRVEPVPTITASHGEILVSARGLQKSFNDRMILKNVDSGTVKKKAMEKGMLTLLDDGAWKVARGETTIAEVLSVTQEDL